MLRGRKGRLGRRWKVEEGAVVGFWSRRCSPWLLWLVSCESSLLPRIGTLGKVDNERKGLIGGNISGPRPRFSREESDKSGSEDERERMKN